MSTTISIILDTRRMKKSDKYPIRLRITFERVTQYYQTVFDLSEDEWEKLPASRISKELQPIRDNLREIKREAENVVKDLNLFSFTEFEKHFIQANTYFRRRKLGAEYVPKNSDEFDYAPFHKKFPILLEMSGKPGVISYSYVNYIKKLLKEGRISTAISYHCSYVSINKFRGDVPFTTITPSYLIEYENWLKSQDLSKTTVGIYLRPLRAIFNEAIENGIMKREKCYPFGKRKYRIPSSKNIKKALELDDIQKIYFYESEPELLGEQQARDYWLFSYFGNGMNPKDIANLKNWQNCCGRCHIWFQGGCSCISL